MTPQELEASAMEVINFTNIDGKDYEGMWGGIPYLIKARETKQFPRYLAEHFAKHLAIKLLLREAKDFGEDNLERIEYVKQILGQVVTEAEVAKEEVPEEPTFEGVKDEEEVKVPTVVANQTFKCEVCGKEFTRKIALAGHMRAHKTA
jgi:hypothetical protein